MILSSSLLPTLVFTTASALVGTTRAQTRLGRKQLTRVLADSGRASEAFMDSVMNVCSRTAPNSLGVREIDPLEPIPADIPAYVLPGDADMAEMQS
eukprot:5232483-Heterocapsa_arctica.AAC.1